VVNTDIFGRNRYVIQSELSGSRDTLGIMDQNMNLLCYAKHTHSWRGPEGSIGSMVGNRMQTTDVRLEGTDASLLGEIHEIPTSLMRPIRKWKIYNEKNELKGAATEKPKLIGSDWVLENSQGVVATIKGDRKKHNYEIITADRYMLTIARCSTIDEKSYEIEILVSNLTPFLVLCYIIVLDLAKTAYVVRGNY